MMNAIFEKSPMMVSRKIGEECLLVPIRREAADLEKIYTLNEVAAFIWEQIDGTRSVQQLVATVLDSFDVTVDEARRDVIEYLELLSRIGAIVSRQTDTLAY